MAPAIQGLHHVTATVDDAQEDLDFCVETLGLRLVKKTVNFDNHHVYHFYYGTESGAPGTLWTTFPYKGKGVRVGTKGAGQVGATAFSVPAGSLDFWKRRLRERRIAVDELPPRLGDDLIACSDRSGLRFELVATTGDQRQPWTAGRVPDECAIRGLHSVTMAVRSPIRTLELMCGLLGFEVLDESPGRVRLAVGGLAPGKIIDVVHDPEAPEAVNGLGTVHHVAMAVAGDAEQIQFRELLVEWGCKVTEIRDRSYFRSIYFREPEGVLFEIATVGPGFTWDEDLAELGRGLKLPPWEEPCRTDIERGLARVTMLS